MGIVWLCLTVLGLGVEVLAVIEWNTTKTAVTLNASQPDACSNITLLAVNNVGNDAILFVIDSQSPDGGGFTLTTGQATYLECNLTSIKFETSDSYTVVVNASDGTKTLSTSITVTVTNLPNLEFTSPSTRSFEICESSEAGDEVVTLAAKRGDQTTGFVFTIRTTQDEFKIEHFALVVANNNSFDVDGPSVQTSYNLTLQVALQSNPPVVTTVDITINIADENDNSPNFTQQTYNFTISEEVAGGFEVGRVMANDSDATTPNNNVVSYTVNGASELQISNDGVITLANNVSLDYDLKSTYNFTVTARDGGTDGSALSGSASVIVTIESVPKFAADHVKTVTIPENIGPQTSVMSLTASDSDTAPNSTLTFNVISQNPASPIMFQVDGNVLKTTDRTFDYENQTSYSVVVRATDGKYHNTININISIADLNDNSPLFASTSFEITIAENLTFGSTVFAVTAKDADISEAFNNMSYMITAGNYENDFEIDEETGNITLVDTPLLNTYEIIVNATDKNNSALTSGTMVVINVDDAIVDECSSVPCLHSVKCYSLLNQFKCACKDGWTGVHCETNIDDCKGVVCANNGTCVDLVDSFTCNCSAGRKGTNCTEECTDATYGRNCAEACSCNGTSKLQENVGSQTCNAVTGDCKCKPQWMGPKCETDVDECQDAATSGICNSTLFRVCHNLEGRFECVCKRGYSENNTRCDKNATIPESEGNDTHKAVNVELTLPLKNHPSAYELEVQALYDAASKKAKDAVCPHLTAAKTCEVTGLRVGSLTVDLKLFVDNNATQIAQIVSDLQQIGSGKTVLSYGSENVRSEALKINTKPLKSTGVDSHSNICEIFVSLSPCGEDRICDVKNDMPYCKRHVEDNLNLILAAGLGVGLPLILLVITLVIAAAVKFRTAKSRDEKHKDDYQPWQKSFPDTLQAHGQIPQNDLPISRREEDLRRSRPYPRQDFENAGFNDSFSRSGYHYQMAPLRKTSYRYQ